MQPAKQGICFSWDSTWRLRFTQEETARKPEPQLKQKRSSTPENRPTGPPNHRPTGPPELRPKKPAPPREADGTGLVG